MQLEENPALSYFRLYSWVKLLYVYVNFYPLDMVILNYSTSIYNNYLNFLKYELISSALKLCTASSYS